MLLTCYPQLKRVIVKITNNLVREYGFSLKIGICDLFNYG